MTTFLITGGNTGIGLSTAIALARDGGRVFIACRSATAGETAVARIKAASGSADVRLLMLDLASLSSVRACAAEFLALDEPLQVLVNNAGVGGQRGLSADGFELHFAVNHLGHFALTQRLMRHLTGRVITVSSELHRRARLRLDDPNWERRRYKAGQAYNDSKLANVLFTAELKRRLRESSSPADAVTVHPGLARTDLASGARVQGLVPRLFGQDAARAARSTLLAATPRVASGAYFGPAGLLNLRGEPASYDPSATAQDVELARELWELSARLTAS